MKSKLIAIDGRFITPNISGIGRYSLGLLQGIAELKPSYKIVVLINQLTYIPQNISNSGCFEFIIVESPVRSLKNQIELPKLLRRHNISVYHIPDGFAPITPIQSRLILTIHDLIRIRCRKLLGKSKKVVFLALWKFWLRTQCNRASAIITVSAHSRNDIIDLMNVTPEKLHVIYNGVKRHPETVNEKDIIRKYGLFENVILYLGRVAPYKNVVSLVNAFSILVKSKVNAVLMIAGAPDSRYPAVAMRVKQLGLEQKVIFTDQINDAELASIFAVSSVFVFPSLYEGFGLPPLEAMTYGVPVVSSNKTCLPEVLGNAAFFVDPTDPSEIADAILQVLQNNKLRNDLINKGLERAKMFTWEKAAEEHLKLYESIYRGI